MMNKIKELMIKYGIKKGAEVGELINKIPDEEYIRYNFACEFINEFDNNIKSEDIRD